jgi:hypothetical protein
VTRAAVAAGLLACAWSSRAWAQIAPPAPETIAVGDWQLAPVAEVRVRGEYTHGIDDGDWVFLTERARLGLEVRRDVFTARVVMQDAHVWDVATLGDPFWSPGRLDSIGAYEAWGEVRTASPRPLYARLGRQPVEWGEGRLLGTSDWSAAGRSLDAIRAGTPIGDGQAEVLAAVLSDPTSPTNAYGELVGARGQWVIHPLFALEAYVLARFAQTVPSLFAGVADHAHGETYAGALRLHGENSAWTWGLEGAYELGRAADIGEDRAAWAAAGHVAHTFERVLFAPSLRLGASYASGDDGGSTYRAFDPLLPDVHTWHGAMDLFSWSNEEEASVRAAFAPFTDGLVSVEYRYARLAEATGAWTSAYLIFLGQDAANTSQELGHEIDGVVTWSPWTSLELTAGYSALVLGDGALAILRTRQATTPPTVSHLAYAQATLRVW